MGLKRITLDKSHQKFSQTDKSDGQTGQEMSPQREKLQIHSSVVLA
jgi:hypothetical protein